MNVYASLSLVCYIGLAWNGFTISPISSITPVLEFDVGDIRRPVWNIAHMVNAAYQVDYYLDEGANSIEFDIAFDDDGEAKFTFHGVPCDCFRSCTRYERFVPFLQYLRQLTSPSDPKFKKQLVLLFMDLKLKSISGSAIHRAGVDIANKMLEHYWQNGNSDAISYVLLSIPSVNHYAFIEGFRNTLTKQGFSQYLDKIGYDFSGNENLNSIKSAYMRMKIDGNIWQGDGITNCLPRGTSRLRECIWRRDYHGNDYNIDKVYWWTVDKMSSMRSVLRLEVDGIITNYPDRLVRVLQESEFSTKFRMANIDDDPFKTYSPMSSMMVEKKSYMMARGGNISHIFEIKPDDADSEEILDNCEPPDEKHWRMEVDPFNEMGAFP